MHSIQVRRNYFLDVLIKMTVMKLTLATHLAYYKMQWQFYFNSAFELQS